MRGAVIPCRTVRFAAVAAAALVAGLLPGTDSAAGVPDGTVGLGYVCAFPSGEQEITVGLRQDYPSTGAVGTPVQPGPLTATVTVPKEAAAALLPAGAATVGATATLTAHITQGESAADASWPGLTAPEAPADGDLVLTLGGDVPPLTVTAPGGVRFAAGELGLTLHPRTAPPDAADPPSPSGDTASGAASERVPDPTDPAGDTASAHVTVAPRSDLADVTATCTPKDGQSTVLGSVPVTAADGTATPSAPATPTPTGTATGSATPTVAPTAGGTATPAAGRPGGGNTIRLAAPPHSGVHDCEDPPEGDPDPAVLAAVPRPPGAVVYPGPDDPPFPPYSQCGYITGYADVGKLNGASVVNDLRGHPSLATIVQKSTVSDFSSDDPLQWYFEIDSIADLALPPADSTFLTYGFMPTSATMALVPRGLMTVITVGSGTEGTVSTTTIHGREDLRLYDVKLNGTTLDVGPDCRTRAPLDIKLVGYDRSSLTGVPTRPQDYSVQTGGPLAQDDLVIPPFTGCRSHGEDLDALFTSAVSGRGNSLNLIQGPLCVPIAESGCDPEIAFPDPPHH